MNRAILVGRLTKDPEQSTVKGEMIITRFTMAIQRRKGETADFIHCTAFGKVAELVTKYVKKGQRIGVEGWIQSRSYTDKDNQFREAFNVIVEHLEFLEKRVDVVREDPSFVEFVQQEFSEVEDDNLPF